MQSIYCYSLTQTTVVILYLDKSGNAPVQVLFTVMGGVWVQVLHSGLGD